VPRLATKTNGSLTITKAPTTISLTASSQAVNPNQTVTFMAAVASTTSGMPTRAVSFYDNGTLLQSVTLANGTASYTTLLAPGVSHQITAIYSGDDDFQAVSTTSNVTVTVGTLDFTITYINGLSQPVDIVPGHSVNFSFDLAPLYGAFPGAVNFTLTGLPNGVTYNFSPSSLAASSTGGLITGTITAPLTIGANHNDGSKYLPLFAC